MFSLTIDHIFPTAAIVMCGVPGSGKTTVAKALKSYFNRDFEETPFSTRYPLHYLKEEFDREISYTGERTKVFYVNRDSIRVGQLSRCAICNCDSPTDASVTEEMYEHLAFIVNFFKTDSNILRYKQGVVIIDGCFTNEKDLRVLNSYLNAHFSYIANCFVNTSISDFYACNIKTRYYLSEKNEKDYSEYDLEGKGKHKTVPLTVFKRKAEELKQQIKKLLSQGSEENLYLPTFLIAPNGFVQLSNKLIPNDDPAVQKVLREQAQMKIEYPNAFY